MPGLATQLPVCRPELVIRPLGDRGKYVVKDPRTAEYFSIGEEERFLLLQLNGRKNLDEIRTDFAERFGTPFSKGDLQEFVALAQGWGFLESAPREAPSGQSEPGNGDGVVSGVRKTGAGDPSCPGVAAPRSSQSLLHWRKNFFDPDRLFTWLEPKIRFLWTGIFLLFSACCVLAAVFLVWVNRPELASSFQYALRWETVLLIWLTLLLVTTLHEFAHGLTCKHYGGEVHEIGFLMLFFLPCFYCNVSDAWLFREKAKRLWVTLAGGYFELFLWAMAVFVWRVTLQDSLVNYLAFVVLMVSGSRVFFNFNPLLKLDGYYLLSDLIEVPNLQRRGWRSLMVQLRRLLWGAPAPEHAERRSVVLYGLASWLFSLGFLILLVVGLAHYLGSLWGWGGVGLALVAGFFLMRGLFYGMAEGEVRQMLHSRPPRIALWLTGLGAVASMLCFVEMDDRASGSFSLRPSTRAEVRAPVASFLQEVYYAEGDRVSPGQIIARLEIPDLTSRIVQKEAEVREAHAKLRLLEVGPRPEEVTQQRRRVERARGWRDLASQDLTKMRKALQADLDQLEGKIVQYRAELDFAQRSYQRARELGSRKAISEEQLQEVEKNHRATQAQLEQAQAQKKTRQALGTLVAEGVLARREKELADAQATLILLEAGTRPEEIDAQRAQLARLEEETRYLKSLQQKLAIGSSVCGVITTTLLKEPGSGKKTEPLKERLREKIGQYFREGDLICEVEELSVLEVEISLAEQDAARVRVGQPVELKIRASPFLTFQTQVDRIDSRAVPGEVQSSVTVYCRLENPEAKLLPGMTGYARVYTERQSLGGILLERVLRFLRTEFWW